MKFIQQLKDPPMNFGKLQALVVLQRFQIELQQTVYQLPLNLQEVQKSHFVLRISIAIIIAIQFPLHCYCLCNHQKELELAAINQHCYFYNLASWILYHYLFPIIGFIDSLDEKSKTNLVQIKGRFSVTSENLDLVKVTLNSHDVLFYYLTLTN